MENSRWRANDGEALVMRLPAESLAPGSIPGVVSVVIPTFNRERYVVEAVASALGQSYGNLEVIVVDDGSVDHTRSVLQERFGQDPRFRYIWQNNSERAAARNNGIRSARGEYVAFLDSDDVWLPGKLEKQMRVFADQPEVAMVVGQGGLMDVEGHPIDGKFNPRLDLYPGRALFRKLLYWNVIPSVVPLVRKQSLDSLGGFSVDPGLVGIEDWELWTRIAYGSEVGYVPEVLFRYRLHPGNTDPVISVADYRSFVRHVLRHVGAGDHSAVRRLCASHYWKRIIRLAKSTSKALAIKHLLQGVPVFGMDLFRVNVWPIRWHVVMLLCGHELPHAVLRLCDRRGRSRRGRHNRRRSAQTHA